MEEATFFECLTHDFYTDRTIGLSQLEYMIKMICPIIGELKTDITEEEDSTTIQFFDVHGDIRASIMTLHLDDNGVISLVQHSFTTFSLENKNAVLFYASLVGKNLEY